jgi:DNA repair protein RadC
VPARSSSLSRETPTRADGLIPQIEENASVDEKESKESKVIHIKDRPEAVHPREMLFEKGAAALEDFFQYLKGTPGNLSKDEFRVLHLSRSKHLIADEVIFRGPANSPSAIPRVIVESAVKKKAAAVILVRHHPTDLPMASDEDIELTKALVEACWDVDIPVIDHIIIGKNGFLSMKRHLPEIFEGEDEIA